jgi:glycosyltransferase involved in cell wall biosynthesis
MRVAASAIIICKNEERAIRECVRSVQNFAECFVVDSGSTDDTAKVAADEGATVLQFRWDGKYPKKKQWALENTPVTQEYVLLLDADERVSYDLIGELSEVVDKGRCGAADIPLRYVFGGKELRHGHTVYKRSLLRAGSAKFPELDDLDVVGMWEVEGHYQPQVPGPVVKLSHGLIHSDPDPLSDYFRRHNMYSDWEASMAEKRTRADNLKIRTSRARLFAKVPFKPLSFFLYSYLFRLGFKDGRAGFDYAIAQAVYYWQIGIKRREIRRGC